MTVATATPESSADTVKNPGYAIVPNSVLRDTSLSLAARLLYSVLDGRRASKQRKGQSGGVRVGVATLAADLGVSESTIRRAAGELQASGWLERSRTGRTNSWRLTNPVRTPSRMASLERSLIDDSDPARGGKGGNSQPPSISQQRTDSLTVSHGGTVAAATEGGNRGNPIPPSISHQRPDFLTVSEGGSVEDSTWSPGAGTSGTTSAPGPRSVIPDSSDQSPVTGLQSITRENYNNTDDLVPDGLSGRPRDESHRGPGAEMTGQDRRQAPGTGSEQRDQTAVPSGQPGSDKKTATQKTAKATGVAATYLAEINAATGASLVATRPLSAMLEQIAAAGIPANEAALTAAAWLAAKGTTVKSVDGFLASIVLPSMADGQELQNQQQKETPTPPAYRDVIDADRCSHGELPGRCALCRQGTTSEPQSPMNEMLAAALGKLGATGEAIPEQPPWPPRMARESRVDYLRRMQKVDRRRAEAKQESTEIPSRGDALFIAALLGPNPSQEQQP